MFRMFLHAYECSQKVRVGLVLQIPRWIERTIDGLGEHWAVGALKRSFICTITQTMELNPSPVLWIDRCMPSKRKRNAMGYRFARAGFALSVERRCTDRCRPELDGALFAARSSQRRWPKTGGKGLPARYSNRSRGSMKLRENGKGSIPTTQRKQKSFAV